MKPIAILHEGNAKPTHDNHLIGLLIRHLELDIGQIDFYGMGTKRNFFDLNSIGYQVLKQRVADNQIRKILLIADADFQKNDAKYGGLIHTKNELSLVIEQLGLREKSDIFVMCDPSTKEGYLESFILSTIPNHERQCIETFLACSQFHSKENHKAILNQIYKTAYPNAPYNFEHENFNDLKSALLKLFA
jgi:hypothetical protein